MWIQRVAVSVPAILAACLVLRATAAGLRFTPDGVAYLEAARSFAAEGRLWVRTDCGLSHEWLSHYAPLYPVLLGSGIRAGWDPFTWARLLNVLCAALASSAAAFGMLRLSGSALTALLAGCAIAMLPESIASYRAMLSEPPYLALVMMGWVALEIGISTKSIRATHLAALSLGLAAAMRFSALPLPAAAALFLWLMERRLRPALEFLAIGAMPPVIVAVINRHFSSGDAPRPFAVHPPPAREFAGAARAIAEWFGVTQASGRWDAAVIAVALTALAALLFRHGKLRSGAALALTLLSAYMLGLLAARTFFDITVDLSEQRHLILLFPLGIVAMGGALPRRLLIPALAFLAVIHVKEAMHTPPAIQAEYNSNHPSWLKSETLDRAGDLGPVCLYTNAPDVIYRRYNRPAEWLPERVEWFTARPEPWCEAAKETLARHPHSAYVYFDARAAHSSAVVSEGELTDCLRGMTRIRLRDGTILLSEPGT